MRTFINIALVLGFALSTSVVHAHHSINAVFDSSQNTTVEGVVDRMSFGNPHVIVYFNVIDENGEQQEWTAEGGAATLLRREGWDQNALQKGQHIQITGFPSRHGTPMVLMRSANLLDPRTGAVLGAVGSGISDVADTSSIPMLLANGLPNLTGAWTQSAGGRPTAANAPGAAPGGMGAPPAGPPAGGRPGRPQIPHNEIGAALQAEYDDTQDPQMRCEPPGMVRQFAFTPHPVSVQQFDDYVVISNEEYGGSKTIYFDDRDLLGGDHTLLGQSIARYEGQKLIIETTNLLAAQSFSFGGFLSDQTTTVETYQRAPDANGGSVLTMEIAITDPGYLTEPWAFSWEKSYSAGYEFVEQKCVAIN